MDAMGVEPNKLGEATKVTDEIVIVMDAMGVEPNKLGEATKVTDEIVIVMDATGIEPVASTLRTLHSTPELSAHKR